MDLQYIVLLEGCVIEVESEPFDFSDENRVLVIEEAPYRAIRDVLPVEKVQLVLI